MADVVDSAKRALFTFERNMAPILLGMRHGKELAIKTR